MSEAPLLPTSTSYGRIFQTFNGSTVVQIWDNAPSSYQGVGQVTWFLIISIPSILFLIIRALFSIIIGGSNGFLSVLQFISGIEIPHLPSWLHIYNTWSKLHLTYFVIFALSVLYGIYQLFKFFTATPAARGLITRRVKFQITKIRNLVIAWLNLRENLGKVAIAIGIIVISVFLYRDPNTFHGSSAAMSNAPTSPQTHAAIPSMFVVSSEPTSLQTHQAHADIPAVTPTSTEKTTSTISTSDTISTPEKSSTTSKKTTKPVSSLATDAETSPNIIPFTDTTPISSSTKTAEPSVERITNFRNNFRNLGPTPKDKQEASNRASLFKLIWWILELLAKALIKVLELPSLVFKGEAFAHHCPLDVSCAGAALVNLLALAALFLATWIAHTTIQNIRKIIPGPSNVVASVLLYQPVFWGIVFSLGYFVPFPFGWVVAQLYLHWHTNRFFIFFLALAVFEFFKAFVHIFSFYCYTNPAKPPQCPTVTPSDVTVIVSTIGNFGDSFSATIKSILVNQPARLIIATVGVEAVKDANKLIGTLPYGLIGKTKVEVDMTLVENKRSQFISAASTTTDEIICYADDSIIWPKTFLKSALAPFEDRLVGMVGTVRATERVRNKGLIVNLLNYIGCIYIETYNFESTATYNIDGGVYVISGHTGLIRREILSEVAFRNGFLNERFEFGVLASALMKPDDDNYMTRYCHKNGWKTVFHNDPDACIGTASLGIEGGSAGGRVKTLSARFVRWARSTWRSNLVSLFHDRVCWHSYPWTTYAMFISSFVNLAIIYDPLMLGFLWLSGPQSVHFCGALVILFLSKCVKPFQFFLKEPLDIWLIPFGVFYGYVHSIFRLYALITITSVDWSGRR